MKELSKLTTAAERGKETLLETTPAIGSDGRAEASSEGRLGPGQYHSEGGLTDGCYALYNSNAGQVDLVLAQLKVGVGSEVGKGECREGGGR